jgi:Phage integrase family
MIKMQPLSDRELLAVLGAAKKESQRDHALLLICYSHAMRANECGKLLVSDVSIKDQTIRIARSKGSLLTVEKLAPHSNALLDQRKTIENWLRVKPGSPYLFPSRKNAVLSRVQVYRLFRYYAEKAGLPDSKRHPCPQAYAGSENGGSWCRHQGTASHHGPQADYLDSALLRGLPRPGRCFQASRFVVRPNVTLPKIGGFKTPDSRYLTPAFLTPNVTLGY